MEKLIKDARKELGISKTVLLAIQHVFAMFGATVLVPLLTGLNISVTLFCAGICTLWFHFITKGKVPIFLGSSFAFLGAFASVSGGDPAKLAFATGGVVCSGLLYVIFAIFIHFCGAKKFMRLFPPIVTGPIIILIGIILAPSALNNCISQTGYYVNGVLDLTVTAETAASLSAVYQPRFIVSIVCIVFVIICTIFGKGMIKIVPILIGIVAGYVVAFIMGYVDFSYINDAKGIVALPKFMLPQFEVNAIITFIFYSLAAVIEHVGDVAAIGATTGNNFIENPGLTRTLLGDGIGTSIAGFLGGPANTTYSENTGVIALTGVQDPFVIRLAAIFAIMLSLFPKIDGLIHTIPNEVIGGISFILYGMISAVGLRTLVEHKIDFTNQRNIIIAAMIMVSGLAFNATPLTIVVLNKTISFGGLAMASIIGIFLNLILPKNDYDENAKYSEIKYE